MKHLALIATALAAASTAWISAPQPASAGADYCMRNTDGDYVCIQSVFGPRNYRGLVYTVNGSVYSSRFNCYNYDYESTSLKAVACWSYEAISSEPKNMPKVTEVPASVQAIMTSGGFVGRLTCKRSEIQCHLK
jgi:hypothetical protein